MRENIKMGNDEFILYIRKNYPDCATSNKQLGKEIWLWLRDRDANKLTAAREPGSDEEKPVPCYWGDLEAHDAGLKLPAMATQFVFDRTLLPDLYAYLDDLGKKGSLKT